MGKLILGTIITIVMLALIVFGVLMAFAESTTGLLLLSIAAGILCYLLRDCDL